jgi:uncharacterized membrane protein
MSSTNDRPGDSHGDPPHRVVTGSGMHRLRNYFLTGLIIAAPLFLTVYITWNFVKWIDSWVTPFIPAVYRPDTYLPFAVPGFGLVVALVFITLLGFLTANFVGRQTILLGESLLDRMPLVRNLYRGLKQIFETVLSRRAGAFQTVALIEYPRKGLWSLVFVSGEARGEIDHRIDETVAVFLPTTPNPTSGFLLFVKRSEMIVLDMSVEDAAKMVISAGLVTPEFTPENSREMTREEVKKRFSPPSAA